MLESLQQTWPLPSVPRPMLIIGAGGIVNDAHLPTYRRLGIPVAGIFDIDASRAAATAARWGIAPCCSSLAEAAAAKNVVFDVAVPPEHTLSVIEALPDGAAVLLQKPMGLNLDAARAIRTCCRRKHFVAAVNFQLRYAPQMLAIRDLMARGALGTISDVEFRLNVGDHWDLFPWMEPYPRVEIQIHSIHYLDLCRWLFGEPLGVWAQTLPNSRWPRLASTRSSIILNYGSAMRCCLSLNHDYAHGPQRECAEVKIEGTRGVAFARLGVMLNYPKGEPDELTVKLVDFDWQQVPLAGSWFTEAFAGPVSNLQRFVAGEDSSLHTSVEDAIKTMALVEACYTSNDGGGTPIPDVV